MRIFDNLLDLVFPPLCLRCEKEGNWICAACAAKLPQCVEPVQLHAWANAPKTLSCFPFSEPWVPKFIHRIKFGGSFAYLPTIAAILATRLLNDERVSSFDAVTFVPLHKNRKRKRGFDQAELLARHLAHELNLPLHPLLVRPKPTHAQAEIGADARRKNIAGAFQPAVPIDTLPIFRYQERSVLLVDDVVTTGATLAAASTVLKAFGVEHVTAITIAFADQKK